MPISPYVARLRKYVGNELLLIASAGVVLRDADGRVLMVKDADSGRFTIIGGAIEIDESPEEAAVREALEEAGVTVRVTGLLGAVAGPEFRIRYPNGDETAYVSIVYEGEIVEGTPRPDGVETVETRWIDASELADVDLSDFTRALLRAIGIQS